MAIPEALKNLLTQFKNVSIGYNDLNFFDCDKLEKEQIGYGVDVNGNSLAGGRLGDWKAGWLAIAKDGLADPILIDTNSPKLTVYFAMRVKGRWEPIVIADSIDNFQSIIRDLIQLSRNRENPVALQNNPVTEEEKQNFLIRIQAANPECKLFYWEGFTENA